MSAKSDLMLDVSQAAELKLAFRRNGDWTNANIKTLSEGNILRNVLKVIRGQAEINMKRLIDCDAAPFIPHDWAVEEHQKGGLWKWNPRTPLYLSQKQENGISGHDLRKELSTQTVLNANVLDYLLDRPELIPEEWKGKSLFFWGTIYRDSGGSFHVRCLSWNGSKWKGGYYWLGGSFDSDNPAALASDLRS